jgi:peptidoglycan/LPS O-acetylase OafA/YrhL
LILFASGLVLTYTIIGKLEKSNGKFNYINYLLQRWLRISVSLFGSILMIYLMPLTGSGPIWHDGNVWLQPACRDMSSLLSSFLYNSNWNAARHNYPLTTSFEIVSKNTDAVND